MRRWLVELAIPVAAAASSGLDGKPRRRDGRAAGASTSRSDDARNPRSGSSVSGESVASLPPASARSAAASASPVGDGRLCGRGRPRRRVAARGRAGGGDEALRAELVTDRGTSSRRDATRRSTSPPRTARRRAVAAAARLGAPATRRREMRPRIPDAPVSAPHHVTRASGGAPRALRAAATRRGRRRRAPEPRAAATSPLKVSWMAPAVWSTKAGTGGGRSRPAPPPRPRPRRRRRPRRAAAPPPPLRRRRRPRVQPVRARRASRVSCRLEAEHPQMEASDLPRARSDWCFALGDVTDKVADAERVRPRHVRLGKDAPAAPAGRRRRCPPPSVVRAAPGQTRRGVSIPVRGWR